MNVQFVNLRSSSVLQYTVDTVRSLFVGHFLWSFAAAAAAAARHLAGISVLVGGIRWNPVQTAVLRLILRLDAVPSSAIGPHCWLRLRVTLLLATRLYPLFSWTAQVFIMDVCIQPHV